MPEQTPDLRPIQVLLDTRSFIGAEPSRPRGGGSKDFFEGNDKGFIEHKSRIKAQIESVAEGIRRDKQDGGFVKVRQREEALAKSHRPVDTIFSENNQFALVGADGVGELLFQVTPEALERLAAIIEERAEEQPRLVENKKTGKFEERVSEYRSELGGIDDIRLYSPVDKLKFSAEEAVLWMRQPNVIGGYIVELFRPDIRLSRSVIGQMIAHLRSAIELIEGGILVRPILPSSPTAQFGEPTLALSVQLTTDQTRLIELPFLADGRTAEMIEASLPTELKGAVGDLNLGRHTELLKVLAEQSLVRSIELPPILEANPDNVGGVLEDVDVPSPIADANYPVIGIIDGGVSSCAKLAPWKVGDAGLVPSQDRNEDHGTFIAGLVSLGSVLNPDLGDFIEQRGCKFFDLDLFPRRELRQRYYSDIEDLFDTLEEKIKVAKREYNVRIFNLSFALGQRSSRFAYSLAADRLDRIARVNDVIFIVPAGNLRSFSCRPSWPEKPQQALEMLANHGAQDQHITAPGEHILGLTVGAVNPVGLLGHTPLLPTTYTRRGPGVGGARKPDLAHFGGVESLRSYHSGLVSLTPHGQSIHNCGTSFASPLTGATIASLDYLLSHQSPRETLLALPTHRAKRPEVLDKAMLRSIAREFIGFGITPTASDMLTDNPHSVTLVFSDVLLAKQQLVFPFVWPQSLVNEDGSCRGNVDVTLSFTPPIDPDHREEAMRVILEAHLHQELIDDVAGDISWVSRLGPDGGRITKGDNSEKQMINTGLKWSPTKKYNSYMKDGKGNTSNWKLSVDSLTRAGVDYPLDGIRFSLIMTITDIDGTSPVRDEMQLSLERRGLTTADITVAHQVRVSR